MPPRAPSAKLVLCEVLQDVSRNGSDRKKSIPVLWAQNASLSGEAQQEALMSFAEEYVESFQRVLFAPADANGVDRLLQFLANLLAGAPVQRADESGFVLCIFSSLVEEVVKHTTLLEDPARIRAMQLVKAILSALADKQVYLQAQLLETVVDYVTQRLNDKLAEVRRLAVLTLKHIASEDPQSPVNTACLTLLATEQAQGVRCAIIESVSLSPSNLDVVLERTRDTSPEVCSAVYTRMAALGPADLSLAQRLLLITTGLKDRVTSVQEAAGQMVETWFTAHCSRSALSLLDLLDVTHNTGVAELVLDHLAARGVLDWASLLSSSQDNLRARAEAAAAKSGGGPGEGRQEQLLPPALAFLWRHTCCRLHSTATSTGLAAANTGGAAAMVQAADATSKHDVLDAFLPASPGELVSLVEAHLAGGPAHRYAACQLLRIAADCMDWADAYSRDAAAALLPTLLALEPCSSSSISGTQLEEGQEGVLALAGSGGTGLWEEAVLAFAGRVVPQPSQLTATLLCAAASLAQQWGLVAGVTASSESAAVTASDPTARHLQILSYVTLTLQSALQHVTLSLSWHASLFTAAGEGASITDAVAGVEPNSTSVTLKWMCEKVVMPGLSMHQPASIRSAALKAACLLCTLPAAKSEQLQLHVVPQAYGLLRDGDVQVAAQAASALLDLMQVYGVRAVEAALMPGALLVASSHQQQQPLAPHHLPQPTTSGTTTFVTASEGAVTAQADSLAGAVEGMRLREATSQLQEGDAGHVAQGGADNEQDVVPASSTGPASQEALSQPLQQAEPHQGVPHEGVSGAYPGAAGAVEIARQGGHFAGESCLTTIQRRMMEAAEALMQSAGVQAEGGSRASQRSSSSRRATQESSQTSSVPAPAPATGSSPSTYTRQLAQLLLTSAEGLARLAMHQGAHRQLQVQAQGLPGTLRGDKALSKDELQELLARLLQLATFPSPPPEFNATQQALAAFFVEYCARDPANRYNVGTAVLPAAWRALSVPAAARKSAAKPLLRFAAQLLALGQQQQEEHKEPQQGDEDASAGSMEQLALALLRAVRCVLAEASDSAAAAPAGTAAEFVKELVQLISSLPLESEGVVPQSYLKALYKHLKEAIREIAAAPSYAKGTAAAEKALVKSLDALCNRVGAMVRPDAKAYPEDYLQALFKSLRLDESLWAPGHHGHGGSTTTSTRRPRIKSEPGTNDVDGSDNEQEQEDNEEEESSLGLPPLPRGRGAAGAARRGRGPTTKSGTTRARGKSSSTTTSGTSSAAQSGFENQQEESSGTAPAAPKARKSRSKAATAAADDDEEEGDEGAGGRDQGSSKGARGGTKAPAVPPSSRPSRKAAQEARSRSAAMMLSERDVDMGGVTIKEEPESD